MAKDQTNRGGPDTHRDQPTRHAQSREELTERSVHGARPGLGKRNGSSKKK